MTQENALKAIGMQILKEIKEGSITTQIALEKRKIALSSEVSHPSTVTNAFLLGLTKKPSRQVRQLLQTKPIRTLSGVAPIAIMTKPSSCPHGKCIFCPGGLGSVFGDTPQSYTGKEPSTMRAIRNDYDAYAIAFSRLEALKILGHETQKVEFIIQSGTFPAMEKQYQNEVLASSLKALNDFSALFYKENRFDDATFKTFFGLPANVQDPVRSKRLKEKILTMKGTPVLEKEMARNETAVIRNVATCIETKPDWCFEPHINSMLEYGTTRIELGIQTIYDDILQKNNRGHTDADTRKATQLMKDSFLKVGYHYMTALYGSTPEKDLNGFKQLFEDDNYKPDALKIYPCLVMRGTPLEDLWKQGKYIPTTTEETAKLVAQMKLMVPEYCRIMRIQRDIPTFVTEAGVDKTNLRQYVEKECEKQGIVCQCIRCREPRSMEMHIEDIVYRTEKYTASQGTEYFIQAEDSASKKLIGFCRMRIPFKPFRKEITAHSAGIRELHVYGQALGLGEHSEAIQHQGIGKTLLQEAEKLAREQEDAKKLLIIAGIGAREYYKNQGFAQDGVYVSKRI